MFHQRVQELIPPGLEGSDWVFGELLDAGSPSPDHVTLVSALSACGRLGLLDLGKKIHRLFMTTS